MDDHLGGASGEADMFESLAVSKQAHAHKSGMARMVRQKANHAAPNSIAPPPHPRLGLRGNVGCTLRRCRASEWTLGRRETAAQKLSKGERNLPLRLDRSAAVGFMGSLSS